MPSGSPSIDSYRRAHEALSRIARGDAQVAARVVGEALIAQAQSRAANVPVTAIDAAMASHGATEATATVDDTAPLVVLRRGAGDESERALVSVLFARHLGDLIDGAGGVTTVKGLLPALDWLELNGPYAPYTAARVGLAADTLARFERVVQDAPIDAPSVAATAAIRALRGGSSVSSGESLTTIKEELPAGLRAASENISVAGEVEGLHRGALARTLSILTGWSVIRGAFVSAGRLIFSFRRPMTVSLDGENLRVVGHTELFGRTLKTFDVRYPIEQLVEIRREVRYPALPVAVALTGLAGGALFGARAVVEGAGVAYFPLIGLGIGLILSGFVFDLLLRALFPGLRGQGRVIVRATDARAVVLSHLAIEEADKLLAAIDRRFGVATTAEGTTKRSGSAPTAKSKAASGASAPSRPARRP